MENNFLSQPVVVRQINAQKAIDLKNQLIERGLIIGVDFTWTYCPAEHPEKPHVEFRFTNDTHATFFSLILQ